MVTSFGQRADVFRSPFRKLGPLKAGAIAGAFSAGSFVMFAPKDVGQTLYLGVNAVTLIGLAWSRNGLKLAGDSQARMLSIDRQVWSDHSQCIIPLNYPPRVPLHPVSSLPTREVLIASMIEDGGGVLGAIAFADFDRLTAFDPVKAERIYTAAIERLRAMLPATRLVVQVDRGQVGLWFPGYTIEVARAELAAIGYALGTAISDGETHILPDIRLRSGCYDPAVEADASAFIARTLAAFALSDEHAAALPIGSSHSEALRSHFSLEQDLRQAVPQRQLRLLFQPLIDAERGCVTGAEALLRWDHPQHGPVSPGRFIPIMESIGLANEIGLWTLNTALREARDWAAGGLGGLRVAVNVSGRQLESNDLPALVQRTLQRHDLPASALELELTESVATSDTIHCASIFTKLHALGVKLAVDDFGTGYSGFSSLRSLAFDKIKIDREFITDVDKRRDSQAICQSIIALGRGLGVRVLAEGVERREEYEWLRRHGCHHFQGYYFARPLTADAFVAFVRDTDGLNSMLKLAADAALVEERLTA